jgi:hypothetical protein
VNTAALASPGHRFWPVGEAAQADYEALRAQVLATGAVPDSLVAARFARRGLPGLIAWPAAEPVFDAALLGAPRPPWTPHADPRLDALAAGFAVLLNADGAAAAVPTHMLPATTTTR